MKEKKEEIRNPVSRHIALESMWNTFDCYLPKIFSLGDRSYGIDTRLPKEPHKKWIAYIGAIESFRERVREEIEGIFSSHVFNSQSYLEIRWRAHGVAFETDGVNGCCLYVEDSVDYGYTVHNVDHYEQVSVLFIALSVYLPKLYSALESFEAGKVSLKEITPMKEGMKEGITQIIKLNKTKGCDMESEECLHWASYLCQYCSRNPKAFFLSDKKSLYQIGDKWEPEGGLPGKNLCSCCHANISKPICPHCGTDNSDYFK